MENTLPNKLTIGPVGAPIAVFENDAIAEIGGVWSLDVIGDRLAWDELSAVVRCGAPAPSPPVVTGPALYLGPDMQLEGGSEGGAVWLYILAADPSAVSNSDTPAAPDLMALPGGTAVAWDHDNGTRRSAMYLTGVSRIGKYLYKIAAASAIWLLDQEDHVGGVYAGTTFQTLVADIVAGKFSYTIAPELAPQQVYGWLPYDSRRNNLHQLCFELGVAILRGADGGVQFAFLDASAPVAVPSSRVAFGGDVEYSAPATAAEVTEHAFFITPTDQTVTLFDNTSQGDVASGTLVVFNDAPVHDLAVTGTLTISESGVNYAVVSGTGILTGKKYTHTTRIVRESVAGAAGVPVVKHVEEMTLVSTLCSRNVARRVLAYFSGARRVRATLLLRGERMGQNLSMLDPYREPVTAFLSGATLTASTELSALCDLVEGYTPTGQGNNVKETLFFTGVGSWTATRSCAATLILVAPGDGGDGGQNGADGVANSFDADVHLPGSWSVQGGAGGEGGEGGAPGASGKILVITFQITAGQTYSYNLPAGGAAGPVGQSGTAGGVSTFGAYSSASGEVYPNGYYDVASQQAFGLPGSAGAKGANGGAGGRPSGEEPVAGSNGGDFDANMGGVGGQGHYQNWQGGLVQYPSYGYMSTGGGGGGGATGNGSGANGSSGATTFIIPGGADGGHGGNGAAAAAPASVGYGCGGNGGNGGAGGGGTGGVRYQETGGTSSTAHAYYYPTAGVGGAGSAGSAGGDGCARLYLED